MLTLYSLILNFYFSVLIPALAGFASYKVSYKVVKKWRLERYLIYVNLLILRSERGVLVFDAERGSIDREIDELRNSIIRGDCMEVMEELPMNSIDFVIADPPYNIGEERKSSKSKGEMRTMKEITEDWEQMDEDEYFLWIKKLIAELYRLLKKTGNAVVFFDRFDTTYLRNIGKEVGFHPLNKFYLGKRNPPPRRQKNNFVSAMEEAMVFAVNKRERKFNYLGETKMKNLSLVTVNEQVTDHQTEKPVSALRNLVKIFTDPGDIVFDPVAGSGSSLVAAKQEGRSYLGIEKKEKYVKMERKRLQLGNKKYGKRNCREKKLEKRAEGNQKLTEFVEGES